VKRSEFNFKTMLKQAVRYGLEYSEVTIMLPIDTFNTARFLSLYLLAYCFSE